LENTPGGEGNISRCHLGEKYKKVKRNKGENAKGKGRKEKEKGRRTKEERGKKIRKGEVKGKIIAK
jgi:hypothetical protein